MQDAVLIPALNEAESLPGLLRELAEVLPDAFLLVVDNGSSDGTSDVARTLGHRSFGRTVGDTVPPASRASQSFVGLVHPNASLSSTQTTRMTRPICRD